MALLGVILLAILATVACDMDTTIANITRFSGGDLFTITGTDCGPTRCMEVSYGTAMSASYTTKSVGCVCQCTKDTPAFREDKGLCSNHIDDCQMASFGRGAPKPQIPFVFLPLKGQIIYPSKEIIFTDVEGAICAVTSAQYLSPSGWVTLLDQVDHDVPFGLYRDEGKTFLQWRGSTSLHARLEGRLVTVHVLCAAPAHTIASCAAFRIAGASHTPLLDVPSIPFHAGEIVTSEPATQSQGLTVLESLAIGVCVLMLVFVYAAGIVFYIHYKQKQRKKNKDLEMNNSNTLSTDNGSTLDSRIGLDSLRMKTNPLLKLDSLSTSFLHDNGLSDVSEHTEDTMDSSPTNTQKFQKSNNGVISAMVHTRRKKPPRQSLRTSTPERMNERLQRRSASPDFECAPHSDLSIIDCSVESNTYMHHQTSPSNGGNEPAVRRKLYFNPVFFESEHLKNPPPAAVEFLMKIREVMSIAKEKMTSKRFIPILSDIPEEELYHTVDLGWDIPCARRGRRFSAISLKRENSRRAVHCGGCPGCDSSSSREQKVTALTRSNSCKTCVSDDYKQKIVRKWLDEVPTTHKATRPVKSIAKVSGTPRVTEQKRENTREIPPDPTHKIEELKNTTLNDTALKTLKQLNEAPLVIKSEIKKIDIVKPLTIVMKNDNSSKLHTDKKKVPEIPFVISKEINDKSPSTNTRRLRKKLPPPPPPPPPALVKEPEETEEIPPEVKKNMQAVILELSKCKRVEPILLEEVKTEIVSPISPKIIIPVLAADSQYYSDDNMLSDHRKRDLYLQREKYEMDSLERGMLKKRRFSLACGPELIKNGKVNEIDSERSMQVPRDRLSRSWRDVRQAMETYEFNDNMLSNTEPRSLPISEIIVNNMDEPIYNNVVKPGPLTIQVRGSPVENRRNINEEFDPDTLDRKPKKEAKKRVDKILLKSGGSFKCKSFVSDDSEPNSLSESTFNRKIGSLRQIYEAKAKAHEDEIRRSLYQRRGSVHSYDSDELAAFVRSIKAPDLIRKTEIQRDTKPPVAPKQRRMSDNNLPTKFTFNNTTSESPPGDRRRSPEERDKYNLYSRSENLNARRSGRKSTRTRSRRTDLRKLYRTEDSGYLSTDSNDSRRRARYLMQLHSRTAIPDVKTTLPPAIIVQRALPTQIESDTDDLESLCDGRSESGGESVETDSVFFGNFDESKQLFAELGLGAFEPKSLPSIEQIDSGFAGETNIVLSGDSDSEHRSVISIVADCDGRASSASVKRIDDPPYMQSIEC